MEHSELNQLIKLLENPSALKQKIEILRLSTNLSEETEGFIIVYNSFNGDCEKIKNYLKDSKTKTVNPLKNKNLFSNYLKYAAVFALLFGTGIFLFNRQEKVLLLSHQFEEPGLINYMSTTTSSNWEDIMYDFKTKNYLKTNQKIEKELIENPENDTLIYFLGVVNFKLNNLKKAKIQLQKLQKNNTTIYTDKSIYYLGLIEYNKVHFSKANTIFKSLSNSIDLDVKNASFEHVNEIQSQLK
jgi:hypothetical protein